MPKAIPWGGRAKHPSVLWYVDSQAHKCLSNRTDDAHEKSCASLTPFG